MDSLRLNRTHEGDVFSDHHHGDDGRRRRRPPPEPSPREEEDTLELSGAVPDEPEPPPARLPPTIALAGDPAAQVASYWLKWLDAEGDSFTSP